MPYESKSIDEFKWDPIIATAPWVMVDQSLKWPGLWIPNWKLKRQPKYHFLNSFISLSKIFIISFISELDQRIKSVWRLPQTLSVKDSDKSWVNHTTSFSDFSPRSIWIDRFWVKLWYYSKMAVWRTQMSKLNTKIFSCGHLLSVFIFVQ